jgi:hypothetical protein
MISITYPTIADAVTDGWLLINTVALRVNRKLRADSPVKLTTYDADSYGYGLFLVRNGEHEEAPTTTVTLTETPNQIGGRPSYAEMVRIEWVRDFVNRYCDRPVNLPDHRMPIVPEGAVA